MQAAVPVTATQNATYVSFSAEINPFTTDALIAQMSNLAMQGVTDVYLMLTTPGGSVMHGMQLYNALRGMPFTLTTHNVSSVNSIGNVVFLAGEKRYASPHTTFMFHGVGFDTQSPARFERKTLLERLESIESDERRIGGVIADRTGLNAGVIDDLFREQQTKDTDFAVTNGIIHEVRELKVPVGAPILSLILQR